MCGQRRRGPCRGAEAQKRDIAGHRLLNRLQRTQRWYGRPSANRVDQDDILEEEAARSPHVRSLGRPSEASLRLRRDAACRYARLLLCPGPPSARHKVLTLRARGAARSPVTALLPAAGAGRRGRFGLACARQYNAKGIARVGSRARVRRRARRAWRRNFAEHGQCWLHLPSEPSIRRARPVPRQARERESEGERAAWPETSSLTKTMSRVHGAGGHGEQRGWAATSRRQFSIVNCQKQRVGAGCLLGLLLEVSIAAACFRARPGARAHWWDIRSSQN